MKIKLIINVQDLDEENSKTLYKVMKRRHKMCYLMGKLNIMKMSMFYTFLIDLMPKVQCDFLNLTTRL